MISLHELPKELAEKRVLNTADAAQFCNFSVPHWRRMVRAGQAPQPIKLGDRKIGWQLGTLIRWLDKKADQSGAADVTTA
jgi:predicted DNA-binding transcriptional regulator AlpA